MVSAFRAGRPAPPAPRCSARVPAARSAAIHADAARTNSTISTSTRPSQNYQYCGVRPATAVLHDLEDDRADQAAVELADAAEISTSITSAERWNENSRARRTRGLGQQRAGDAGIGRAEV